MKTINRPLNDPVNCFRVSSPAPAQASALLSKADLIAEGARFVKAFGDQGALWFVEGKSFAEAQELALAALKAENKDKSRRFQSLSPSLAKFAEAIKLPT